MVKIRKPELDRPALRYPTGRVKGEEQWAEIAQLVGFCEDEDEITITLERAIELGLVSSDEVKREVVLLRDFASRYRY